MTQDEKIKFQPLSKDSLYEGVVEQITRSILTGQMQAGDQIPTETELAGQFGVSRTVVREAVKALSYQGLVAAMPGRGTFISQPPLETVIQNIHLMLSLEDHSFDDLRVVRELLEVPIARLAAEQAGSSNIEALATHLQGMRDFLHEPDRFVHYDWAFHAELANATGNVVLAILGQTIVGMLQGAREMLVRVPEAASRALFHHEEIFEAIVDKNPIAAEKCMHDHLTQFAKDVDLARGPRTAADDI